MNVTLQKCAFAETNYSRKGSKVEKSLFVLPSNTDRIYANIVTAVTTFFALFGAVIIFYGAYGR